MDSLDCWEQRIDRLDFRGGCWRKADERRLMNLAKSWDLKLTYSKAFLSCCVD